MLSLNTLARTVAIVLSIAAGTISVIGLANIFSGAYWAVVIVASILEVAKVVTAAWLDHHWKLIRFQLKLYLCIAILVLMGITSLGIYGFFARSHIEQQAQMQTGEVSKIPLVQMKIDQEKQKLTDFDKQIEQLDKSLQAITDKGKSSKDAKSAVQETDKQRKNRTELVNQKSAVFDSISKLELEKAQLQNTVKKQEVEVGPLKYLASLFNDNVTEQHLEQAVRILILCLIFVFDPLAIALIVASNTKVSYYKMYQQSKVRKLFFKNQMLGFTKARIKRPYIVKKKKGRPIKKTLDLSKIDLDKS
jgi:hypothetical protein